MKSFLTRLIHTPFDAKNNESPKVLSKRKYDMPNFELGIDWDPHKSS